MKRISLSEKLIISFMLLSMGAIGIVGAYSYFSARKAQMSRTYDQLASVKYLKKKEVETFYANLIREVATIANDKVLQAEFSPANQFQSSMGKISSPLPGMISTKEPFENIILSTQNTLLAFHPIGGELVWNKAAIKGNSIDSIFRLAQKTRQPYISDLLRNKEKKGWVQYIIVQAQQRPNQNIKAVGIEISSVLIDSLMSDWNPLNGLGESGETYLAGKDRMLRSNSRFIEHAIFRTRIDTSTSRLAFGGHDGTWLMNDYRGVKVLGTFTQLNPPLADWVLIAEIDLREAMIPIYSIRNNVLFITVFIAVIVFFATWLLSRKITRPIIRLKKAAHELGEGKLGTLVDVTTNDEIGELAQSFNGMSEQLKLKDSELKEERARRMHAAFDGQDKERQRLSRELHDGLGQSLIAQKLRLEAINTEDQIKTNISLNELKLCSDQLVEEVRRISNALMPAQLTQFGLLAALRQHCEEIAKYGNIEVSFDTTGSFDGMDRKTKTYIFRIVQEALNNIVKHSTATYASVEIAETRENIFLSISDNGKGFDEKKSCQGNGLNNMRERTNLLQGTFSISSQPGIGTTIEIQIPS